LFLLENEDIFAFRDPPTAAAYFEQGLATVLLNPLEAAFDSLIEVILVPPFPVGLVGLIAIVGLWRAPGLRAPTALMAVLLSALFTFVSTMVLFPVATLWGTFLHSSGPLLVGLGVVAALGGDALLARISAMRHWDKPNVLIAPIALVSAAAVLTVFQVAIFAQQSRDTETRYVGLAGALAEVSEASGQAQPHTLITDHPMWLADVTDGYAIVLPDEDLDSVRELAGIFEASWVVVVGKSGRYPDALLTDEARACLATDPTPLAVADIKAWLFELAATCEPS
jgi:hypothetical protein